MRVNIDGKIIEAAEGMSILEAAGENGIHIPTLCYLREINCISVCRVCMVEADGKLMPACSTAVAEGMEIVTDSETVRASRRRNLELICSDHHMDCTDCPRGADCELRALCKEYEVDDRAFGLGKRRAMVDESTPYLVRDNAKCILCRRCEATCAKLQGVKAIAANNKGGETNIGFGLPLAETDCVGCGQCVATCPTGALIQRDDTKKAWKAIFDKEKYVVAAVSPSAYMRIGELFGEEPDTDCGRKLAEILRKIGFDAVFDMADSEKAAEKLMLAKAGEAGERVLSGDCPAWRRYVEAFHPELTNRLLESADWCGELAEHCKARAGDREVFIVSISNCIAGKGEGGKTDVALSTREAFEMIRRACVSSFTADKVWAKLQGEDFDSLPEKEAICQADVSVLSVSGLAEAEKAIGELGKYGLIQVRACPGGCMSGGGMPRKRDCACETREKGDGVLSP